MEKNENKNKNKNKNKIFNQIEKNEAIIKNKIKSIKDNEIIFSKKKFLSPPSFNSIRKLEFLSLKNIND